MPGLAFSKRQNTLALLGPQCKQSLFRPMRIPRIGPVTFLSFSFPLSLLFSSFNLHLTYLLLRVFNNALNYTHNLPTTHPSALSHPV